MVSALDLAKRALVKLLKSLALIYKVVLTLERDSTDAQVRTAFRKVSAKTHPDRGGDEEHQKTLNAAHDDWKDAAKASRGKHGGSRDQQKRPPTGGLVHVLRREEKDFRFQSVAVLLTYQKFEDKGVWKSFVSFVRKALVEWKVKYWCATLETNADGTYHTHLTLQFFRACNRHAGSFVFQGVRPNAKPNDLLGEGFCKKRLQDSVNRAFFYVWANKEGTAYDEVDELCVAGNYFPAWTSAVNTYAVAGSWLDKLFKAYKLSLDRYDEYVHLCRDGVPHRKRNLEAVRSRQEQLELRLEIAARTKRLQSNPAVYQKFPLVPEAEAWKDAFKEEALRYPVLLVHAPSRVGKTEWANSLGERPLELRVGALGQFPEGMRRFDKKTFTHIVLDDVRDLKFLSEHQEKLQGNYKAEVEFGSTAGGTCVYFKDLWRVPFVITVNNDTRNLDYLVSNDFVSKKENVHFLSFSARPGEAPPQTSWPLS